MSNSILIDPISPSKGALPPLPPFSTYNKVPDSTSSSPLPPIAPVNKSRPLLDPPNKEELNEEKARSFVSNVISYMKILEEIQSIYLERLDTEFTSAREYMGLRFQNHLKEQRKIEEATLGETWWDYSRKITTLLLAGTALIMGGVVFTAAATSFEAAIGVGMMTSGGLAVSAESLYQSGTHKEVANAMVITGSVIGLLSGTAGLFQQYTNLSSLAAKLFVASTSLANNVATLNKESWAEIGEKFKSKNTLSEKELEKLQNLIELLSSDAEGFTSTLEKNIADVSKLSNRYQEINNKIVSAFSAA